MNIIKILRSKTDTNNCIKNNLQTKTTCINTQVCFATWLAAIINNISQVHDINLLNKANKQLDSLYF